MKDVACEEWGWVAVRVVSFCNLYITYVTELGSDISAITLGVVARDEEGSDSNMMTTYMYKVPSKSIYIDHRLVIY